VLLYWLVYLSFAKGCCWGSPHQRYTRVGLYAPFGLKRAVLCTVFVRSGRLLEVEPAHVKLLFVLRLHPLPEIGR
jgi:hypothetical protein